MSPTKASPTFLSHADVKALEGWDWRAPILVVVSCALIGLCWVTSRISLLPLGDLLFVLAVAAYATIHMQFTDKAAVSQAVLPLPVGGCSGSSGETFRSYIRQRHEFLRLLTKHDKRTQALALGVGGLVMLLWRIFGQPTAGRPTQLGNGRFQVQGWIFTLTASKVAKFVTRRTMVTVVRLSRGAAALPVQVVILAFCGSIAGLIVTNVEQGQRLFVLRAWLTQWFFAMTCVDAAWCFVRWQLLQGVWAKLGTCSLRLWFAKNNLGGKKAVN
mmetsp:Transcript_47416/g.91641  ORF Transcript_47416/g.91641 Transcript_47416/m.91641 type:complete len:272 (-) Transcript_47416:91-906(-)|eukprot:CAMPEP_0172690224 /NCGR_PEP_ID=MMETSP1074-20121228/23709_1 /TAXON_ID=2916 /ORGANISM="Ceratium fusus, Strain PA161109" /LENGTH=271 /DNA_ID=CAMNT_0013510141 /DNA_START=70 /DNA_END=885 /DNA_ORIENTATION=+